MVAHIRRPVCIPGQIRSLIYGSGINHRFGNKMSLCTQAQALSYPWTVSGMGLGQRTTPLDKAAAIWAACGWSGAT